MKSRKGLFGIAAFVIAAAAVLAGFASCSKNESGGASGNASGGGKAKSADSSLKALQAEDPAEVAKALSGMNAASIAVLTQQKGSPSGDFKYDLNEAGDGIVIRQYTAGGFNMYKSGQLTTKYEGPFYTVIVPEKIEDIPVVEIGDKAFNQNDAPVAVVLPQTIRRIGEQAFTGCDSLAAINLPESLKEIGVSAFYSCDKLTTVNLPEGLEYLGNVAFMSCTSLTAINLPEGLQYIGGQAFRDTSLVEVKIPEGIQVIGTQTFAGCTKLLSVSFPASLRAIAYEAFQGCSELADIAIPDSKTALAWVAWSDDDSYIGFAADGTPGNPSQGKSGDSWYLPVTKDSDFNMFSGDGKLKLAVRKRLQDLGYLGPF
jgi:hypothetical protein